MEKIANTNIKKYIDKQLKVRDEELSYDFLPAMQELIDKPESRKVYIILFFILGCIITSVIWASLCKIDISVSATGSLMPEDGFTKIISVRGGEVTDVLVNEREEVTTGQLLYTLDTKEVENAIAEYEYSLGKLETQYDIYNTIYTYLTDEDSDKESLEFDTASYGEYKMSADEIVMNYESYNTKMNQSSRSNRQELEDSLLSQVISNLNSLDSDIHTTRAQLEETKVTYETYQTESPVDGQIIQMTNMACGDVITSGETMMYIVPSDSDIVFDAYVNDADVADLYIGQQVQVKLAALDNSQYEYVGGTVSYISDISMKLENTGTVYEVRITMDEIPDTAKLGMEGACNIITGKRSVMNYFMEPFTEGLKASLKEK